MNIEVNPQFIPPLDPHFKPMVLFRNAYNKKVANSDDVQCVSIVLERHDEMRSRLDFKVLTVTEKNVEDTYLFVERTVKFLLWARGGWKLCFAGPNDIGQRLKEEYRLGGKRAFDAEHMEMAYGRPFEVELLSESDLPEEYEKAVRIGGKPDGCRIGIDLGASDYKISAVVDGEVLYSDEIPWDPKPQEDPQYHIRAMKNGIDICASKMERIDAIGVSSAGIYLDNEPRVASLYRSVSEVDFSTVIRPLFKNLAKEYDVPLIAINDGDVSALAGAQYLKKNGVIGLAMGSSEAVGYLDQEGYLKPWLNELAFAPVDFQKDAVEDEWSKDMGVGAMYFSQQAVNKLAVMAGLSFSEKMGLPTRLVEIQNKMKEGDETAHKIYETIGIYLGYAMASYREFYDYNELLLLGRVSSGKGGDIIVEKAREVLAGEFSELGLNIHLPDEKFRRVGQSIAAASLPPSKLSLGA